MSNNDTNTDDPTEEPYSPKQVDGRGPNEGRWLEYQLEQALRRWGYNTALRQTVFGLEIDVVGRRREEQNDPTDSVVAECKDWNDRKITPKHLFRLCAIAFACRATPILCHTTELTDRASRIAYQWEVRVLDLEDIQRATLPAPKICKPTTELLEYRPQYTAREMRGSLPIMFQDDTCFSYDPQFEPDGKGHKYKLKENNKE